MISILDPRLWLAALLIGAALFLVGDFQGRKSAKKTYEIAILKTEQDANKKLIEITQRNQKRSDELQASHAEMALKSFNEGVEYEKEITRLKRAVSSRTVRVFVPAASCGDTTTDKDSGIADGAVGEKRAELLPTTVNDLIDIAAGADAEVRRTNLCIDAYNKVRSLVNSKEVDIK